MRWIKQNKRLKMKLSPKLKRKQELLKEIGFEPFTPPSAEMKNAFKYDSTWTKIPAEEFKNLTILELISGKKRIIFQLIINDSNYFVATHSFDANKMKDKYPDEKVFSISSLLQLFTPDTEDKTMTHDSLDEFLNIVNLFNAKIIDFR